MYGPIIFPMSLSSSWASSISSSTWPQPIRSSIFSHSSSSSQTVSLCFVKVSTALRYPSSSGTALISFRVLVYRLIKTALAFGTTSNPTIPVVCFTMASNGRPIARRNIAVALDHDCFWLNQCWFGRFGFWREIGTVHWVFILCSVMEIVTEYWPFNRRLFVGLGAERLRCIGRKIWV